MKIPLYILAGSDSLRATVARGRAKNASASNTVEYQSSESEIGFTLSPDKGSRCHRVREVGIQKCLNVSQKESNIRLGSRFILPRIKHKQVCNPFRRNGTMHGQSIKEKGPYIPTSEAIRQTKLALDWKQKNTIREKYDGKSGIRHQKGAFEKETLRNMWSPIKNKNGSNKCRSAS